MSEHARPVVIEAPMSFTGSAKRITRLAPRGRGWITAAAVAGVALLLLIAWALVLAWYVLWGIWLVPYRLIRRSQRKQKRDALRHEELVRAIGGRP